MYSATAVLQWATQGRCKFYFNNTHYRKAYSVYTHIPYVTDIYVHTYVRTVSAERKAAKGGLYKYVARFLKLILPSPDDVRFEDGPVYASINSVPLKVFFFRKGTNCLKRQEK